MATTPTPTDIKPGFGPWRWIRSHWLDILLPPMILLLAAGITRHVMWVRDGRGVADVQRHYSAAVEAQKKGDFTLSAKELGLASKAAPNDPNVHLRIAALYHSLNLPVQAALEQEKALLLRPPKEEDYMKLLASYCKMGRFDDADRVLKKEVVPRWRTSSEVAYYQGIVHFYRDKGSQALQTADECFVRSLALDPDNTSARYQHAECLSRMGRPAEAENEYRQVLKAFPNDDGTYQGLASVLRKQGKTTEAERMMARFQELNASRRRIQYIRTKLSLNPSDTAPMRELGDLYMRVREPDQAVSAYTGYLKSEPTDVYSLRNLAKAYHFLKRDNEKRATLKLADALDTRRGQGR